MEDIPRPKLNKIPGNVPPLPRAKEEGSAVKNLTKLTQLELLDLRERQKNMISNKLFINKLPDKGERIHGLLKRIIIEIERRAKLEEVAAQFSELNIAAKGIKKVNKMEWSGGLKDFEQATFVVDESDDETDPLRILAQRPMHERIVKVLPPEEPLITAEDLREIESFKQEGMVDAEILAIGIDQLKLKQQHSPYSSISTLESMSSNGNDTCPVEPHVQYLIDKTKGTHVEGTQHRERFMPYRTTVSDVHDPEKESKRPKGKYWENTGATPPPIKHCGTKMVSLIDSVNLQINFMAAKHKIEEQHHDERMLAKAELLAARGHLADIEGSQLHDVKEVGDLEDIL